MKNCCVILSHMTMSAKESSHNRERTTWPGGLMQAKCQGLKVSVSVLSCHLSVINNPAVTKNILNLDEMT